MHSSALMAQRQPEGWLARATIAGFVALGVSTVVLVIVSGIAGSLGEVYRGTNVLFDWMYGLTHNPVVELGRGSLFIALALHLAVGMLWAILYALVFEPRLRGFPGWLAGIFFSGLPFVLSVVVFLPLLGAGLFGAALEAGPLPLIGNAILHVIYGATLGAGYSAGAGLAESSEDADREVIGQSATMRRSETRAARGILIGAVLGGVIGVLIGMVLPVSAIERLIGSWPVAIGVAGVLSGGAVGALVGSMAGLTEPGAPAVAAPGVGPPGGGEPLMAVLIPLCVIAVVAILIVSIGSALLTIGNTAPPEHGGFGREQGYNQAIALGLSILAIITGAATILSRGGGGSSSEGH